MTEVPPEDLTEAVGQPDSQDPEEYEPGEASAVSPDTGTAYEGEGEPASTPHDAEPESEPGDAP